MTKMRSVNRLSAKNASEYPVYGKLTDAVKEEILMIVFVNKHIKITDLECYKQCKSRHIKCLMIRLYNEVKKSNDSILCFTGKIDSDGPKTIRMLNPKYNEVNESS